MSDLLKREDVVELLSKYKERYEKYALLAQTDGRTSMYYEHQSTVSIIMSVLGGVESLAADKSSPSAVEAAAFAQLWVDFVREYDGMRPYGGYLETLREQAREVAKAWEDSE